MCGIFGAVWTAKQPSSDEMLRRGVALTVLAHAMEGRGSQSWGVYAHHGNSETLDKNVGSIERVSMLPYVRARLAVGHTRFATQGAVSKENAHPFKFGRIVGVHNGVIYNASALDKSRGQRFAVDSMHLIHALDRRDPFDGFDGYGTVVWHDASRGGALQVGRFNNGEFCAAETPYGVIFASTQSAVKAAADAAEIKIQRLIAIDERHRYAITPAGVHLAERDLFTCGRTSTRSWQDGFGATWRNQLADWDDDRTTHWRAPATRPAVSTSTSTVTTAAARPVTVPAPAARPASALVEIDDTDDDRARLETLAVKSGMLRNDARRVWDANFDPMNEQDEFFHVTGLFDHDLFMDVQDTIDHDAWAAYFSSADDDWSDIDTDEAPAPVPAPSGPVLAGLPLGKRVRL